MSYQIGFYVKVAGTEKDVYSQIGQPDYYAPTYNVRDIFVKSMDWDYHQGEYYPMNEVLPKIVHGINELRKNGSAYKQYEPDNGWGSVSSALNALKSIYEWFYPESEWDRKFDEDIPLECIYMRW